MNSSINPADYENQTTEPEDIDGKIFETKPNWKVRKVQLISENNIPVKLDKLKSIYEACKTMTGYAPTQNIIRIETLNNKLTILEKLEYDIEEIMNQLKPKQKERNEFVNSREDGISKIIAEVRKYVRGNYGINSKEWNSIKNIKA